MDIYDKKQDKRSRAIVSLIKAEDRSTIEFKKKVFEYDDNKKTFASLDYPDNHQVEDY